jgi:hypothetical protein
MYLKLRQGQIKLALFHPDLDLLVECRAHRQGIGRGGISSLSVMNREV